MSRQINTKLLSLLAITALFGCSSADDADVSAMDERAPLLDLAAGGSETSSYYLKSCAEIYNQSNKNKSGPYTIDPDGLGSITPFTVYCEMSNGGGWTLAMKIDGTQVTFTYDAELWTNADTYQPGSGTDMLRSETKTAAFSTVPFSHLLLGMAEPSQGAKLTVLWQPANTLQSNSLLELIQSGENRPLVTAYDPLFRRNNWKHLVPNASLQLNCNREAVNAGGSDGWARVRIGILSNNEDDCDSPDSVIGFGITDPHAGSVPSAGNLSAWSGGDNGLTNIPRFGYIFVR